jgi:tryptophanyl-tRNA synthetase
MRELRHAVGLRALSSGSAAPVAKETKTALPSFKQYREKDGQFYFKLVDAKGQVLLQSLGFSSPKETGQAISRLQTEGSAALSSLSSMLAPLESGVAIDIAENLELLKSNYQRTPK